jgi:glycosyltransferase involved in cell wall biosynthesis
MRVCLLTNILSPYRIEFFNELAQLCDLHVIFDTRTTPDRKWSVDSSAIKFSHEFANGWRLPVTRPGVGYANEQRYLELSNRTIPILSRLRPHAVVSAEMGLRTIQAALYSRIKGVPLVGFWEGTPHTESGASVVSNKIRRALASQASAFWVNGQESASYIHGLGVESKRIYQGMTGVDTSYFRSSAEALRETRLDHRAELGLNGTVLTFSGSFVPRKGIMSYLHALSRLRTLRPHQQFSVLFIGEGPLRADIERWAKTNQSVPVVITGFVQLVDLPRYYVCGDWFVLPTLEDCWPLATLEPLVCGLPQIFSIYNGATADLSIWPDTGITADPLDVEVFSAALAKAVDIGARPISHDVVTAVSDYYSPKALAARALHSLNSIVVEYQREGK